MIVVFGYISTDKAQSLITAQKPKSNSSFTFAFAVPSEMRWRRCHSVVSSSLHSASTSAMVRWTMSGYFETKRMRLRAVFSSHAPRSSRKGSISHNLFRHSENFVTSQTDSVFTDELEQRTSTSISNEWFRLIVVNLGQKRHIILMGRDIRCKFDDI